MRGWAAGAQASQQADSSVALYHFNASLYLLRVTGAFMDKPARKAQRRRSQQECQLQPQGPGEQTWLSREASAWGNPSAARWEHILGGSGAASLPVSQTGR